MSAKPIPKKKRASTPGAKRPISGTKRPISPDSPKGKVAQMMLQGQFSFEQIAKRIGTTTGNALQHAKQLAARGFPFEIVDGKAHLRSSESEVFAAKPAKPAKKPKPAKRKVAAVEPAAAAEPAAPKPEAAS